MNFRLPILLLLIHSAPLVCGQSPEIYGTMKTRWSAQVDPAGPLPEHPRPQLVRSNWSNLNGQWDYAITAMDAELPTEWQGKITVPFCIESQLSGVQKRVSPEQRLWYRRTIATPTLKGDERAHLHFGAVDWEAHLYVNGQIVHAHRGGYAPFSVDITGTLTETLTQEIVLSAWDPSDRGKQPRGKQSAQPKGIFYTAVTGIWQTVWLEVVPSTYLTKVEVSSNLDTGAITVLGKIWGQAKQRQLEVAVHDGDTQVAKGQAPYNHDASGFELALNIPEPKLWSPDSPHLYGLKLRLLEPDGRVADEVSSYCAIRQVGLARDAAGHQRFELNKKPTFLLGLLDQGWWPDGLYTAPTDEALRSDIEAIKAMGFNVARKHVKVEPSRWYYWADKLGLIVWQDMPNGKAGGNRLLGAEEPAAPEDAKQFRSELAEVIEHLYHHPSIAIWSIFNEGWGQHDSTRLIGWLRKRDPGRIVGGPSGWQDYSAGQLLDIHRYPGPAMPVAPEDGQRALVLSEFGGVKMLAAADHLWKERDNWGYVAAADQAELRSRYETLRDELRPLIRAGLCAAIYTQFTDVETEVNGFVTYERAVNKAGAEWLAKTNAPLFAETATTRPRVLLPTGGSWAHMTEEVAESWHDPGYDDTGWKRAHSPFGDPKIGAKTAWDSDRLWLRQTFKVAAPEVHDLMLKIHNNDRATVYLNGKLVRRCSGFSPGYRLVPLGAEGAQALVGGENVIAIEIENEKHPHFLDAGLIDMRPTK